MIIRIKNLKLATVIGVNARERRTPQDVVINVEMHVDAGAAVEADDVGKTVDYGVVAERIAEAVRRSRFRLLESLAARVLEVVTQDDRVQSASVEIDKPGALRSAESVSVSCSYRKQR